MWMNPSVASLIALVIAAMISDGESSQLDDPNVVSIADFTNGATATPMETINDPVMGGSSHSTCTLGDGFLDWTGTVNVVSFLNAPGFCIVRTAGKQTFPKLETSLAIVFVLNKNEESKLLLPLGAQVSTGARSRFGLEVYFEATLKQKDMDDKGISIFYAKWDEFVPMQFGKIVKNGPKLELEKAYQIGLSTYDSHQAGDFRYEIVQIVAPISPDMESKPVRYFQKLSYFRGYFFLTRGGDDKFPTWKMKFFKAQEKRLLQTTAKGQPFGTAKDYLV